MRRLRLLHRSFDLILKPIILCVTLSSMQLGIEAAAPQTTDRPPFSLKVHVDLVILNVAVVDEKGADVTSLRKQDFIVYEDDVEQQVSDFLPVEAPFHLVLALDTSISTRSSLSLIKKAAGNFTDQLRFSDRIAISEINSSVRDIQGFTSDRRSLNRRSTGSLQLRVADRGSTTAWRMRPSVSKRQKEVARPSSYSAMEWKIPAASSLRIFGGCWLSLMSCFTR